MTVHSDDNGNNWYENLDECKADNLSLVKCYSPLQFFRLRGKTIEMLSKNMETIVGLLYCYIAPKDSEKRYYIRQSHGYSLQELFFYAPYPRELSFSGESEAIDLLRARIRDGQVWLLFNQEQVDDMTAKLKSLWKNHYSGEGKLPYNTYISILDLSLKKEDYMNYGEVLTGYKTVVRSFDLKIEELWNKCKTQ